MDWLTVNLRRGPALEAFVAPARARPRIWRLALGIVLIVLIWVAGGFALTALARLGPAGTALIAELGAGATTPRAVLAALLTFTPVFAGLWLILPLLHRRSPRGLAGPAGRIDRRAFAIGFAATLAIGAAGGAIGAALTGAPARAGLAFGDWLRLLPGAAALLFLQVTAEELVFRGYLLQQLAARFRPMLVWAAAPAFVFGALHWAPGFHGAAAPLVVATTALMGWALALITARTGNIGAALGIHYGVNVPALLLIGSDDALGGLALWRWPAAETGLAWLIVLDLAATLLALVAAAWVWRPRQSAAS